MTVWTKDCNNQPNEATINQIKASNGMAMATATATTTAKATATMERHGLHLTMVDKGIASAFEVGIDGSNEHSFRCFEELEFDFMTLVRI
jgi:hypothetical protein